MPEELAYVLINPYTIIKSRTGGVIARLLSRSSVELIAARMFAPSESMVSEYMDALGDEKVSKHKDVKKLIQEYLKENYLPDCVNGQKRRVMMLLFKGNDAVSRLRNEVVGHITKETIAGETIRDTYGDYIKDAHGKVKYFEPAVIIGTNSEVTKNELNIWIKYSDSDSGILKDVIKYPSGVKPENTLVIIKPDCFQWPSGRAGNIIDMFSKTGLYIVAVKVVRMSVLQAEEFYGPVKEVLKKKFKNEQEAEDQFNKIIKFMTGCDPKDISNEKEKSMPGKVKCLVLVYQGENAVSKIRTVLGTTDPTQAAPATVRKEFGRDVMVNTAHASDSPENAIREMNILKLEKNDLKEVVESFYGIGN